ncbi:MAG: RasGEF domain-containing protein [Legionella sp.]
MTKYKLKHSKIDLSLEETISHYGIREEVDELEDLIDSYSAAFHQPPKHNPKATRQGLFKRHESGLESEEETQPSPLASSIGRLLTDCDRSQVESLLVKCQQLVDTYGFIEFKKVFEEILMNRKIVSAAQHDKDLANALKVMNQFVINKTADTLSAIVIESAKMIGKVVMEVLRKPREDFAALAIQEMNEQADAEIDAIEQSDLEPAQKSEQILGILKRKEKTLLDIEQDIPPADYYLEKARVELLKKERARFMPALTQNTDLISAYIRQDLLQYDEDVSILDALKLRTIKWEQYILIAEKLLERHQAHAALIIFSALNSAELSRLKATMGGLSEHAQAQFEHMEKLFAPREDFQAFVAYAKQSNDYMLPEAVGRKMEVFEASTERDAKGKLLDSFMKIRWNCERLEQLELSTEYDKILAEAITKTRLNFDGLSIKDAKELDQQRQQQQKELSKRLYDISLKVEPRDQVIKPKSMELYETIMEPIELDKRLHYLIKYFRANKTDRLIEAYQNLVATYGFGAVETVFDKILVDEHYSKRRQKDALKVLHQQIMDTKFQTFVGMITAAGQTYAKTLMDILDKPDDLFLESAEKALARKVIEIPPDIEKLKVDTQKKIDGINRDLSLNEDGRAKKIIELEAEAAKELKKLEDQMTLAYHVENARRKIMTDQSSKPLLQCCQAINNYVVEDILSNTSISERTIALERYVLLAEKMIASGNLDTAFHIFGGLSRSGVMRLKATSAGLSEHAQEQLIAMGKLFDYTGNYSAIKKRAAEMGVHSPINLNTTDVKFCIDGNGIVIDDTQKVKNPVVKLSGMQNVKSNLTMIMSMPIEDKRNPTLVDEIYRSEEQLSTKKKDDVENLFHAKSLALESRDDPPELSKITKGVQRIMHCGLYESPQQEMRERNESMIGRVETGVDRLKARMQALEEDGTQPKEDKAKAKNIFSAFIDKANAFIEKSKVFLSQYRHKPNDKIDLKSLSKEQLVKYMQRLTDDVFAYHEKHGGDSNYEAYFKEEKEKGYTGIDGQKRHYSADILIRLHQVMSAVFNGDGLRKQAQNYNYLQSFVHFGFMQNDSAINDLLGKESTLVKMVRTKIIPLIEELAQRQGLAFVEQQRTPEKYTLAYSHNEERSKRATVFFRKEARPTSSGEEDNEYDSKVEAPQQF